MDTPIWARDIPVLLGEVYAKEKEKPPEDPDTRFIDVIEWLRRIPSRWPRRTHVSDVLGRQRILTPYEIGGIKRLRSAIERGGDLRMYLGETTASLRERHREKLRGPAKTDLFFSDWGLLHFHLGADLSNRGLKAMRTRRVLIAHVTPDDAYLIDLAPHGKGHPDTWGNINYLETLQRNWPHILAKYEMKGVMPPPHENRFTASDYIQLRQARMAAHLCIGNKVFMGPGLGISGDGSSTAAVLQLGKIKDELDWGEALFRQHYPVDEAQFFVRKDGSSGYFVPESDAAYSVFPSRTAESQVAGFFRRLLEVTGMLERHPEGTIWTARSSTPTTSAW